VFRDDPASRIITGDRAMPKSIAPALSVVVALVSTSALAQNAPAFEKKNYNYAEWAKGRFSEVVTATGPAKMIFLAGVGAEDENGKPGDILHKDNFVAQCKYAYDKIKRLLEKHGAGFGDVVKIVSYVTDMRYQADYGKCRSEVFGGAPPPAHTLLNIVQLAWPGMMVEVDVTAMVPLK
jgi:2-iminobutanoate/2-iminopropanoate deaminase